MYRILSKYNFITVLPFQETFLHASTLHKNVKLSKELLRLNYLKYSPFTNPNIITFTQEKSIILWFYKQAVQTPVVVPESYLLFKELKNRQANAIYVIYDDVVKVLIIKESLLVSTFTLEALDDNAIAISMDEFQIFKRVDISADEYSALKASALASLNVKELLQFNQLNLDKKILLNRFVEYASYPVAGLIAFAILVSYTQESMLKREIESLKETYKVEKSKNQEIKELINEHNSEVRKWESFASNELAYVEPITLLESVYSIFKDEENAHLVDLSITTNKMSLKITTDKNPVVFLNRLNEIKYFSSVIIQNTHAPKNSMKIITYDIEIKMLKNV